jgi:hypothetical protein
VGGFEVAPFQRPDGLRLEGVVLQREQTALPSPFAAKSLLWVYVHAQPQVLRQYR